ncbi:MAG: hypothetical protein NXI24_18635 [bacterium]|nr:hypothetical protein [bacterium]
MTLLIVLSLPLASACKSGGGSGTDGSSSDGEFQEDQPQYPETGDDPFFFSETPRQVSFRVLITRGNYQVRQVNFKSGIARREDPVGDREQMEFFTEQLREIDFVDMELTGRIQIRLSPLSGQIEHIAYVNGETPRTWQASKYFQDDVSRFRFYAPSGGLPTRRFEVQYLWRIDKRTGISDEENRKRAVEWLKKQTR